MYERKPIKDFSIYEVSTKGEVFSMVLSWTRYGKKGISYRDKKMALYDNGRGYKQVFFCSNYIKSMRYVHRLVAEVFIPNPQNKPEVNHKDGDKSNNNVDNLEWVTRLENVRHAIGLGLHSGKRIMKITSDGTTEIYESGAEASRQNNIHAKCVTDVANGTQKTAGGFRWKYI